MAFCSGCGTQVADGTTFCSNCGKPIAGSVGGGAAAAAPAPITTTSAPASGLADNIAGLLCYSPVGLIADIIFLVTEPYKSNPFIRFHAFQSLFFGGACFALSVGLAIVGAIVSSTVPLVVLLLAPIEMILWLGILCLWVFMMVKAYGNAMTKLPIVGAMAEKQAKLPTIENYTKAA